MQDKSSLRTHYLELLKKQDSRERSRKSQLIGQKLFGLPAVQKAGTILFYASLPGEVDTFAMIKKAIALGKRVALPIVERNQRTLIPTLISSMEEVHNGIYGITQPRFDAAKVVAFDAIDAVIVPGLAFDTSHNRLGRGAGYYDRFLSVLPKATDTVGLAFDFQITDCLPTQAHDIRLQQIIANQER